MDSDSERLAELLAEVSNGDPSAFRQLYRDCAPHLYGLMLRILKRPALAEEALQDCFLKIWQKSDSYDSRKGAPMAWLSAIARYRALDMLCFRPPEISLPDPTDPDLPELTDTTNNPLLQVCVAEDMDALRHCLSTLTPEQRQSVLLAYYNGYTLQELADAMQAPLGTVKSWLRRGLVRLRECLHR